MAKYEDNIDASEISSAVSQSGVQMQRVSQGLEQMNSKLEKMTNLFGKVRDYTQDELREMQKYRDEVGKVASAYRDLHGNAVKGMSDYSVAIKALEDQIKQAADTEKRAIEENKKLREKSHKIQESTQGRMNKAKKKDLVETLGTQEKSARKIRKLADDEMTFIKQKMKANQTIIKDSKKIQEHHNESLKKQEKLYNLGEKKIRQTRRQTDLLEVMSDMHLPGVSHAATVAKYASRGARDAGDGGAGTLGKMFGGMGGLMRGLGIAGAGYTAMQGYKVYNTAQQMAPMARTLQGQVGAGAAGVRRGAVEAYGGYGGIENLQTQIQLNRALGGAAGSKNLRGTTDIANMYGLSREEVTGTLGAGFHAGMSPGSASEDMKKIMAEGVKGGMDRARITQFTQEALGVQQELFRASSENNAQSIATAMAQLMRASGKGEKFLHGAAFQGVRGIDAAVKSAGRGQLGGQAAGTLFRAFGFGAGSGSGTEGYYDARKQMEKGIFGAGGGDAVSNINKIFDQYYKESGGDKKTATLRMADELGLGINQVEQLDAIRGRAAKGAITQDDLDKLKDMQNETKDPMIRLVEIQSRMDANIAKAAGSAEGIASIVSINTKILQMQEAAVDALRTMAQAMTGEGTDSRGGSIMATAGMAAGFGAMMAPKTAGKILGKGGKGMLKGGKALGKGAGILGRGGKKAMGKMATKLGGKAMGRLIPGVGLAMAGMDAYDIYQKWQAGEEISPKDWAILASSAGAGVAGLIPGAGTAVAAGLGATSMGLEFAPDNLGMGGGSVPKGAAPRPKGQMLGGGVAGGGGFTVSDPANTSATAQNTKAIEKLTEAVSKSQSTGRTPAPANRVQGSYR